MTEVEIGIYTHRWSVFQVRAAESIARHTKSHQYAIHITQAEGTCHQNMNRAWRRFSAPYVVLMDEDVIVLQDGWLGALLGAFELDPQLGVVGCSEVKRLPTRVPEPGTTRLAYHSWIPAYVMAFRRDRVPFLHFDENIPGRMGMTDLDACLQITSHKLRVAINPEVVVYHPMRDDDAVRVLEQRPLVAQQREWHPEQCAYMAAKWGAAFAEATGAGAL